MNERDFCYWLQGYLELTEDNNGLTEKQVDMVKEHLSLVFKKVTGGGGGGNSSNEVNDDGWDEYFRTPPPGLTCSGDFYKDEETLIYPVLQERVPPNRDTRHQFYTHRNFKKLC